MLTHLQRVTMLPTGSNDDDDILTEAPQGYSQLYQFAVLRAGDFCFWGFIGGNLDGVDDACEPLG